MSQKADLSSLLENCSSESLSKKAEQTDGLTPEQAERHRNKIHIDFIATIARIMPWAICIFSEIITILFLVLSVRYLYTIWNNEDKIFNLLKDVIWSTLLITISYCMGKIKN